MKPSKPPLPSPPADKLPPHDLAAEQGALGAVLLDGPSAWETMGRLFEILPFGQESFYDLRHQTIYEAMGDLFAQRKGIDAVSLHDLLKTRSQLTMAGGLTYLAELPDKCATATMVDHYAVIVREKALLREIIRIGLASVEKVESCEDISELVGWLEKRVVRLSASGGRSAIQPMTGRVHQAIDILDRIQAGTLQPGGLPTGIPVLDRKTMGLMNGDYVVLAGRPSTGKSAFALNILTHLALDVKVPVGFISLEMSGPQLTNRIISSRANVDSFRIQRTKLDDDELRKITDVAGKIAKAPLYIADSVKRDLNSIKSAARRMKIDHKIQMLSIDFLQLIFANDRTIHRSSHEEIGFISGEIKQLAVELDLPILMISQLNRESEKGKRRAPRLSDLRGSGSIEQDADVIWLMWRPGEGDPTKPDTSVVDVELIIDKQRNGPTGEVDLLFHRQFTQFVEKPLIDEEDHPLTNRPPYR